MGEVVIVNCYLIQVQDLKSTLVKSRGLSSGDVTTEFKYKNKVVNFKVDTESNVFPSLYFFFFFSIYEFENIAFSTSVSN